MVKTNFNPDKFRELLLYVADRSVEDADFGATKLNKILFFSDFIAYGKYGHPITGAHYQRLDNGPAPKELLPIQSALVKKGHAYVFARPHYGHIQKRLLAQREPNLTLFSGEEIAVVDEVIEALRGWNATRVSGLSHDASVWASASDQQIIPYQTVFVSQKRPNPSDIRRGLELAVEHGWI